MKNFRVLMLVMALSVSTYAGDMDNGNTGEPPPEPPPATTTTETDSSDGSAPGETDTTYAVSTTEITLILLRSLLALL